MEKIKLRNVEVYPFRSADDLIDYADEHKGILVAVNAEKILNANEVTLPIINGNIAYCDGSGAVLAAHQKGAPQAVQTRRPAMRSTISWSVISMETTASKTMPAFSKASAWAMVRGTPSRM